LRLKKQYNGLISLRLLRFPTKKSAQSAKSASYFFWFKAKGSEVWDQLCWCSV